MACPVCGRTMQGFDASAGRKTFWCPCCGTLKEESGGRETFEVPRWTRLARDGYYEVLRHESGTKPG